MSSFFGSGPLPDWKHLRDWLGQDIPWHLVDKWEQLQDDDWLDRFVGGLVRENGEPVVQREQKGLHFDALKRKHQLLVTMELPPDTPPNSLRLFAVSHQLRLEGLPQGRAETIPLPCRVHAHTGKPILKDGKLQIEFRRHPATEEEVELFLHP